jgi:hypothetical protein
MVQWEHARSIEPSLIIKLLRAYTYFLLGNSQKPVKELGLFILKGDIMIKYIIKTDADVYIKSGKEDTTSIEHAKQFDTFKQAQAFIHHHIGSRLTNKIISVLVTVTEIKEEKS